MSTILVVSVLVTMAACASRSSAPAEGESSTSSEATTESGSPTDLPSPAESDESDSSTGDTGVADDPCGCEEGVVCAATCSGEVPSLGTPGSVPTDFRCIDDPACPLDDLENPECLQLVCGSAYAHLVESCSVDDPLEPIDMKCGWPNPGCSLAQQDCPEGEKCILRPLDQSMGWCVPVEGTDAAGEACTTVGAPSFRDSCDQTSMCWTGELSDEPGVGICLSYCDYSLEPPGCPIGMSCEVLTQWLELCTGG